MYALQTSAVLPSRVLVIASAGSMPAADVAALRRLGVTSFAMCADPERVPKVLAEAPAHRPFECVVCPHRAKDDTAVRLAGALAGDPKWADFPVLFLSGDNAADLEQTGALVLSRPYSIEHLGAALQKVMSPLRRPISAPVVQAKPAVPRKAGMAAKTVTTSDLLRAGNAHFQAGRLDEAAKLFSAALQRSADSPEACIGMAGIERTRGNPEQAHPWVIRAAAGYMRRNDEKGFSALLPHLPQSRLNIFCQEASAFMSQGLYRQACRSFQEAAARTGEPLHALIARACAFSDAPRRRMEILCDAFEALGQVDTAKALRLRLLHEVRPPAPPRPSWLDRFPVLQEIVYVAGWTAHAWRHA